MTWIEDRDNFLKDRISNQLRIHWNWLKDQSHEEVSKFISAIIENSSKEKTKLDSHNSTLQKEIENIFYT